MMQPHYPIIQQFEQDGYAVVNDVFSEAEVLAITQAIELTRDIMTACL